MFPLQTPLLIVLAYTTKNLITFNISSICTVQCSGAGSADRISTDSIKPTECVTAARLIRSTSPFSYLAQQIQLSFWLFALGIFDRRDNRGQGTWAHARPCRSQGALFGEHVSITPAYRKCLSLVGFMNLMFCFQCASLVKRPSAPTAIY